MLHWQHNVWFAVLGTVLLLVKAGGAVAAPPSPMGAEFFENRIRPVLAQECYECHRTGGKQKGGLALDSRDALRRGGESGPAIVPGDPAKSLLLQAIRHSLDDRQMPKGRAPLEPAVIADFAEWVRQGAPDPRDAPPTPDQLAADTDWNAVMKRRKSWWSFQPLRKTDPATLATRANHPVDRFLAVRQAAAGLTPAGPADRATLIRRLSFALRGLPPTPTEVAAFVQDPDVHAYAKLVDAFLASPRFGERWARHWMDWVRYADSHGSEGDPLIPYAWRYRDYLIRAWNADVPYDQLVREHLAGDLLPQPRLNNELGLNESALGIGHLRMVFHGFAPTDALDEQVRFTDDQISTVSKTFLGLTVGCARCHDHKFDPISQRDFYAWYGIFVSCPPAAIAVDAPNAADTHYHAAVAQQTNRIKALLADAWSRDAEGVAAALRQPDEKRLAALEAAKDKDSLGYPFYLLRHPEGHAEPATALAAWWQSRVGGAETNATFVQRWDLTDPAVYANWRHDGPGVAGINPAGEFALAPEGERILTGLYPAGVYSHLVSSRDRGVLLSPRYQLKEPCDLWLRIAGDGGAVARYVVQSYPRDGTVFPVNRLGGGQWRWMKFGLDYWQGDQIHVEVTTAADQPVLADIEATRSWFGVSEVVLTRAGAPAPSSGWPFRGALLAGAEERTPTNVVELAESFGRAARLVVGAWRTGTLTDSQALFLDALAGAGWLRNQSGELPELAPLVTAYRTEAALLRVPTRAQGVIETEPVDQPLFNRGNHKQPGAPVPRRFLEAFNTAPYPATVSGRLQLAEDFLRPDNPLTSRVIVNRVWLHLFGRGIVATPDNFGRMGQEPTNPELLDFLAGWMIEHGYSLKGLIRYLVMTDAWQRSSDLPPGAREQDPDNLLLTHFNVRRLEAEAVRDNLLAVSGDLQPDEMYGPPVLGGATRRSVYVRVKRNDLDPFLHAFDAPAPASTVGLRDVTNVPGQSLTLLNDPFVLLLAEHWAASAGRDPELAEPARRVVAMFERAIGRAPNPKEAGRLMGFVAESATLRAQSEAARSRLETNQALATARLAALRAGAEERARARRKISGGAPAPVLPEACAVWDFRTGLVEQRSGLPAQIFGNARIADGALLVDGHASYVAGAPLGRTLKAKTLEAVVQLTDLHQQGGGVVSVQDLSGNVFDAIVFGEQQSQHWMAGSDGFRRTQDFAGAAESEAKDQPVHLAITYAEDGTIAAYRNGQPYGQPYQSKGLVTFVAGQAQILLGNRHGQPGGNKDLAGKIFRARVYDRALDAAEIATLAAAETNVLTEAELRGALTDAERAEQTDLQLQLVILADQLKVMKQKSGMSSEWADLAHALFNLKEFIYLR